MAETLSLRARTVIGPLTTTFTPPASCTNVVAGCPYSCSVGYRAVTCDTSSGNDGSSDFADATDCWPPAAPSASTPTPPFGGWGFYSPGFICPQGYTSACSTTQSGAISGGHGVEYSMLAGETAVGCCPIGYTCSVNPTAQTCQSGAGYYATFPAVTCEAGQSNGLTEMSIPTTVTANSETYAITTYQVYAPMIELRWQPSDLPANNSQATTTGSATATSSSTAAVANGLSTAAKAGIGVGIGVAVLLALIAGLLIWWHRRRVKSRQRDDSTARPESRPPRYENLASESPTPNELRGNAFYEMEEQRTAQEVDAKDTQHHQRHELPGSTVKR